MPPEREDPVTPNSGARQQSHGAHLCSACGWQFPNPHPSPKQRRAHRKHCGRMEGYTSAGGTGELSDGSNRGATVGFIVHVVPVEELESGRVRSEGNDCEEEVVRSSDIKTPEETVEGKTLEHADVLSIINGSGVSNECAVQKLEHDLHSNDVSYISNKESCANNESSSTLVNGSEKISTTLARFPPENGSDENSDISSVENGSPSSTSIDLPDKESQNRKAEKDVEMLSDSAACVYRTLPETKLANLMTHARMSNEFSDDFFACKMEPTLETNQLNKETIELAEQVPVIESYSCPSNVEIELGFKHTAPTFERVLGVVANGVMKSLADGDKGDLEHELSENKSSCQLCTTLVDSECHVGTSGGSVLNVTDEIEAKNIDDDVMKQMYQETFDEPSKSLAPIDIDILDSTRTNTAVQNVESHDIPELEEAETGPHQQNNAVEDHSLWGPSDDRKEPTMLFAQESPGLLSESNSEREAEQAGIVESCTSEINHASQCSTAETYHESISYQASEKQEGCIKAFEVDNTPPKEICIANSEQSIGSSCSVQVLNGHYSVEGNSSKSPDDVIIYDAEVLDAPKAETSEPQDVHGKAPEEDESEAPFNDLKEKPCENLNQVNLSVHIDDQVANVSEDLLGIKGIAANEKRSVLNASVSDISEAQNDYRETLKENGSEDPIDGPKTKLADALNQVNSSIQIGGEVASSDVLEEPFGNQRTAADDIAISSRTEYQEHVSLEKAACQNLSHDRSPGIITIAVSEDSAPSDTFEGNTLLDDHLNIDENTYEPLETAVVVKPSTQFRKNYENNDQSQSQEPMNPPFQMETTGHILSKINKDPCDGHNDSEKGDGCSSKTVIGDDEEGTHAFEGKHDVHEFVEECEVGNKPPLTDTGVACDDGFRGTATEVCQLEKIPSTQSSYAENHDESSLVKDEVHIEESGTETTTSKHLSSGSTTERVSECALSSADPESARTDAPLDALASTQSVELKLGTREGSKAADPSGGVDCHSDGTDAIDRRQVDVVALSASTSSIDSMSDHSGEEPALINRLDVPTVNSQQPNGNRYTKSEMTISDGSWLNDTDGIPSPASGVKAGNGTILGIRPVHSSKHCTFQLETNDGEIMETPASRSTSKLRTPLKSLLDEASIESKQEVWLPNGQSPVKEQALPKATSSGAVSDLYIQPAVRRVVQKEWNSPARLPQTTKNSKVKGKGKPQWIPFMCCPSAN